MKRTGFKQKNRLTAFHTKARKPLRRVSLNKVKKPKAHDAGWWQKKADRLMQDINRLKYRKCLVCGGKNEVGHHFITKALSSFLRYIWANLIPLCFKCHFAHHIKADPQISAKIIEIMGKEWHDYIESHRRLPQQNGIKYYQDICQQFEKILLDLQNKSVLE